LLCVFATSLRERRRGKRKKAVKRSSELEIKDFKNKAAKKRKTAFSRKKRCFLNTLIKNVVFCQKQSVYFNNFIDEILLTSF
jgi:hypothetical protein